MYRINAVTALLAVILMMLLPLKASAAPNMQIGVMDDSMCLFNRTGTPQELAQYATGLKGRWIRTNVYYRRVVSGGFKRYDRCVGAMPPGINVQLTIVCNGRDWTPEDYATFVAVVVSHFKGRVHRISLCNEPNYPGWMHWAGDEPGADAYAQLYRAGAEAAWKVDPSIEVYWGELSSLIFTSASDRESPLDFIRSAWCIDGGDRSGCQATVTDCIAYHPYQNGDPLDDDPVGSTVGVGRLGEVQGVVDQAFNAGMLRTPQGGKPPLCLTEFGYQSLGRARGDLKGRALSDATRANFLVRYAGLACAFRTVSQIILHQMRPSPTFWPGDWDSSLIGRDGKPDQAYTDLANFLAAHPDCVAGI